LPETGEVRLVPKESPEGLEVLRHSMAHIMADAVQRLWPEARLAIGPAVEHGFYYDIDCPHAFSDEDLRAIEKEMKRIIKENAVFARREMGRDEALRELAGDDVYKREIIEGLDDGAVSTYSHGRFTDICRGPHLHRAGQAGKAFRLLNVAGAYWRGDETRPMLQRIYGTAFWRREALEDHLKRLAEARARDHRVLGTQLGLFSIDEEIGPGLVLWHPKGQMVRMLIEDFWKAEHLKRGYRLVSTPHIASERIFEHSGHLENYAENMYAGMEIENRPYRLKPMNCPAHIKIYQSRTRSYRDLPLRLAELGTVYRYERSGVLHGMLRVRGFTQDDAHIFCTPEQITDEVLGILDLVDVMMDAFDYTFTLWLATMPEKHLGSEAEWARATAALKAALEQRGRPYELDEGGGAFYAPKIDVKLRDALGREWQGPTIQVDLNLPKRFGVAYIGADNAEHEAIMIHRTVLGSMERFVGGLIEHTGGAFPAWLAPEQVRVLPISDPYADYARRVRDALREAGFRAELDAGNEKIGARIRRATLDKVPYMLIVGEKEQAAEAVAVRHRTDGDQGAAALPEFMTRLREDVEAKA
jgi:threonyl-tRNA synthetase